MSALLKRNTCAVFEEAARTVTFNIMNLLTEVEEVYRPLVTVYLYINTLTQLRSYYYTNSVDVYIRPVYT